MHNRSYARVNAKVAESLVGIGAGSHFPLFALPLACLVRMIRYIYLPAPSTQAALGKRGTRLFLLSAIFRNA